MPLPLCGAPSANIGPSHASSSGNMDFRPSGMVPRHSQPAWLKRSRATKSGESSRCVWAGRQTCRSRRHSPARGSALASDSTRRGAAIRRVFSTGGTWVSGFTSPCRPAMRKQARVASFRRSECRVPRLNNAWSPIKHHHSAATLYDPWSNARWTTTRRARHQTSSSGAIRR